MAGLKLVYHQDFAPPDVPTALAFAPPLPYFKHFSTQTLLLITGMRESDRVLDGSILALHPFSQRGRPPMAFFGQGWQFLFRISFMQFSILSLCAFVCAYACMHIYPRSLISMFILSVIDPSVCTSLSPHPQMMPTRSSCTALTRGPAYARAWVQPSAGQCNA